MRYLSDLLTRETYEIRDRFTIAYLEASVRKCQPYIESPPHYEARYRRDNGIMYQMRFRFKPFYPPLSEWP